MLCSWEGITKEVTAGGTLVETTQNKAGTWRLKTEYGVGCMPGQPLSAAGCGAFVMAYSNTFTILPTQQACIALQGSYAAAVSTAKNCDVSDPSLHCQHLVLDRYSRRPSLAPMPWPARMAALTSPESFSPSSRFWSMADFRTLLVLMTLRLLLLLSLLLLRRAAPR